MTNIKRIILTRQQLNEVLKEENTTTVQLNTTGNTITSLTNAVTSNQHEINNAGKYGDVNLHISSQKLTGSNDSVPTQHVEVEKGQNINQAIQQQVNPTVLSDGGDVEVSGDGISEYKSFSKRQIEEARLKKIHEGYKITKRKLREHWEEKPNDDANQWNDEFKMFMQGIRNGEAIEFGDNTIAVEIFKGRTASNDPRYVTFTKGDNRLQDDHFYIQHSQPLKPKYIREIYNCVGWEYDENCEDYEQLNEDEVDWNQKKIGLNQIDESYKWYLDNNDDISGGFDSSQFISHFREIEEKYYDLPEDYELEDYYNKLLEEWGDFSDEERSSYKSFEQYCDDVISDYLYEKYSEKGMNKMQESKIEINPKNKGKFTATKERTGKSTEELTHSKNPLTRKRANFAKMAKRNWKPLEK